MSAEPPVDSHDDPSAIRKQIEATRERIANAAEALAYKADVPARLKENVGERVDAIKSAIGDAATSVVHGVSDATQSASALAVDATVKLSQGVHDVSASAKTNLDGAGSSLDDTASNVKSKLSDVKDTVRGNIEDLGDAAQQRFSTSGEAAKSIAISTKGFLEKNPLGLAIGSVAVGFLLGLALPVSDLECDNVGPLGEKVKSQAKSAASEIVAQGRAVVSSAVTDALAASRN